MGIGENGVLTSPTGYTNLVALRFKGTRIDASEAWIVPVEPDGEGSPPVGICPQVPWFHDSALLEDRNRVAVEIHCQPCVGVKAPLHGNRDLSSLGTGAQAGLTQIKHIASRAAGVQANGLTVDTSVELKEQRISVQIDDIDDLHLEHVGGLWMGVVKD
jgi:hypothetical protein